ncbi:Ribose import ATP-binding protein RbsA [Rubripirellula lacrimiformis]|uniref:Ribose import ATP-binding protein RbsA n=1 Tax=Rubripirellula lacrimiformis TaxID=1930273 RepID=A0A517N5E4_9BACT|nr:sugar ABC transporter ATP-binding protein [Rubripirellula lacrimiformis]QDT02248.1 Ribose import ATP-binding protein RbsA [Rubripirellula lacrimiformis]
MTSPPLLSVRGLTKTYAVTVLDDAQLDIRPGEIHALLGANGAGKSTMCRIIAGLTPATSGEMHLSGFPFAPDNKTAAEAAGVQIVQQELNQIATLSVAENILIGRIPSKLGFIQQQKLHRHARAALDRFGLQEIATTTLAGSLGIGQQQMIEIATALDRDCRILILDEPTAALSHGETETLFIWLDQLRSQGVGIIYISHRLDEVIRMTDRITVLRDGKHVITRDTDGVTHDQMVDLMTGETGPSDPSKFQSFAIDAIGMRVQGMTRGRFVQDVSFTVQRGQRLGIAGLVGAGRTELLRLLFGADPADAGELAIGNGPLGKPFRSPRHAVQAGLAMVTEDRKENGLLLSQSIGVNATLASLSPTYSAAGWIRRHAEHDAAEQMRTSLDIRCNSVQQSVGSLSGGNQQKVAIAKWLLQGAEVFFFDEPTRGIDVAARRRIYSLFDSLAADGKSIVIVSSDLDELMQTCDRIAVMSAGRIAATFDRGEWSEEQIMKAAFAHQSTAAV